MYLQCRKRVVTRRSRFCNFTNHFVKLNIGIVKLNTGIVKLGIEIRIVKVSHI